jgi:probable HAF family extracellular repeat protein
MTFLRGITLSLLLLCASLAFAQADSEIANANVTFTTVDVPGAVVTSVDGINTAGDMVGYYAEAGNGPASGFLYSGGNFAFLNYPSGNSTRAQGINDSGLIVGWAYVRQESAAVGFAYDGTTFTTVRAPGKSATFAYGINNAGDIVGGDGSFSATKGFELVGTRFKNISPPGTFLYIYGLGINKNGGIVGLKTGGVSSNNGFAYNGGKFQTLIVPGAQLTEAWGVNDSGIIVGWYQKCSPCVINGFALMNGKYTSLSYPGAIETFAIGINASGQVVGAYTLDGSSQHGFVTSPITVADFE